jgi:glutamate synthase (NADPH/NADH) large chain
VIDSTIPERQGLYDPANEHDACGVGFVAHIRGQKSHSIIEQGLLILNNLDHRGAVGADPLMGDGAGVLIQLPDALFREEMGRTGRARLARRAGGSRTADVAQAAKDIEPVIRQVFIGRGPGIMVTDALERKLYILRKAPPHAIQALKLPDGKMFYVPSMSARTMVYKGMLLANQVGTYYLDLQDPRAVSAMALAHQRFSTNTFPTWDLAHPFRMIAHNGEINALRGNVNWMRAREHGISSPVLGEDLEKVWPLIYDGQSDSASFDNALELLVMGGYSLAHAMMMLIPKPGPAIR